MNVKSNAQRKNGKSLGLGGLSGVTNQNVGSKIKDRKHISVDNPVGAPKSQRTKPLNDDVISRYSAYADKKDKIADLILKPNKIDKRIFSSDEFWFNVGFQKAKGKALEMINEIFYVEGNEFPLVSVRKVVDLKQQIEEMK